MTPNPPRTAMTAVRVRELHREGELILHGEPCTIPELAIVPTVTRDPLRHAFHMTGGWGVVHIPSRLFILTAECEPHHLRALIDHLTGAGLDWSAFDPDPARQGSGAYADAVRAAWGAVFHTDPPACDVPTTARWGSAIARGALAQAGQNFDQYQRAHDAIITADPNTGKPRVDFRLEDGTRNPEYSEAMASLISGLSVGYLLAAFHRADPAAADSAAAALADMLDEGATAGPMVHQWRHQLADGAALALPGVPPPAQFGAAPGPVEAGGPGA